LAVVLVRPGGSVIHFGVSHREAPERLDEQPLNAVLADLIG